MDDVRGYWDTLLELFSMFNHIETNLHYVIGNLKQIRDGKGEEALLDVNGCVEMLSEILKTVQKQYKLETDYMEFYEMKLRAVKEIIEKPVLGHET